MRSHVKTTAGTSDKFGMGVGVHEGSLLSSILFNILMDKATRGQKGSSMRIQDMQIIHY